MPYKIKGILIGFIINTSNVIISIFSKNCPNVLPLQQNYSYFFKFFLAIAILETLTKIPFPNCLLNELKNISCN